MEKKNLYDIDLKGSKKIATTDNSIVYKLKDGSILKIIDPEVIIIKKIMSEDIEAKILSAKPIPQSPEILIPTAAVYDQNGNFCGYIMPCAMGIDFNTYDDRLTINERTNLQKYAEIHHKLESILSRNPDIVFPDICTCDNIFINPKQNHNLQLIDYEGLQIGEHKALTLSTSLGTFDENFSNPKYTKKSLMYTKELDKKSSIFLFYLTAFNINLLNVGRFNYQTGRNVTVDDIFDVLNLDDPDLCHKTWLLFNDKQPNEFLGEDILRLHEKYDMRINGYLNNCYIKKLIKKK